MKKSEIIRYNKALYKKDRISKKVADKYGLKRATVLGSPIFPKDKSDHRTLVKMLYLFVDLQYKPDQRQFNQMKEILFDWAYPKCKCRKHLIFHCPSKRLKSKGTTNDKSE